METMDPNAAAGLFAGIFMMTLFFVMLPILVLIIVAQWMIFTKAGKPGWACLIPIYNTVVLLEIVGKPWWWLFLLLIPIVNIVFAVIILNELSKSFGKSASFTVGLVFLSIIFYPILGFGKSRYIGPGGRPAAV